MRYIQEWLEAAMELSFIWGSTVVVGHKLEKDEGFMHGWCLVNGCNDCSYEELSFIRGSTEVRE